MSTKRRYTVVLELDVDATDPLDAAHKMLESASADGDVMTYSVIDSTGRKYTVDLLDESVEPL